MKRNVEILELPDAHQRSIASLQNWVNNTGSVVRPETAFLYSTDLFAIGRPADHGILWIKIFIESVYFYFRRMIVHTRCFGLYRHQPLHQATRKHGEPSSAEHLFYEQLYLFQGHTMCIITHLCLMALIVLLLMIPMVFMQAIQSTALQMICVTLMSGLFTAIMTGPIEARTVELFGPLVT